MIDEIGFENLCSKAGEKLVQNESSIYRYFGK
jgi:hypothetical protein